jgi:hypothetical protein
MNTGPSHAKRQARYRARLQARHAEREKELTRLRAELASLHQLYDQLCASLVSVSPKPQGQGAAQ